jgi:predicted O-methyltransferase YrrM
VRVHNDSVKALSVIRTVARRARATYRYGLLAPPAAHATEAYRSMVYSAYDEVRPSERLTSLALEAARRAHGVVLDALSARERGDLKLVNLWPGEHYRLLAGLVDVLGARRVVEIGTGTGLSALAMLSAMPSEGRVVTFDVVPWQDYPGVVLRPEDFTDGRLEHRVADLSEAPAAERHLEALEDADLIFLDAAKDGEQERRFLELFDRMRFTAGPILVLDDIRLWTMLEIWRNVSWPKLDVTSFGHWSGTGLVDYG